MALHRKPSRMARYADNQQGDRDQLAVCKSGKAHTMNAKVAGGEERPRGQGLILGNNLD